MRSILDLGDIDEPLLLFGGSYGNLEATEALLAQARQLGITGARMIHTGDVVAYCADPAATVALVRGTGMAVVQGNCEESLGAGSEDCGCGFAEGTVCDRLSAAWYEYCVRELPAEDRSWMAGLPARVEFRMNGAKVAVVHGAPSRINRFVFASDPLEDKRREFALAGSDVIVGGHSGLPFIQPVDGRLWVNAGAIGMPANDGTPRCWFALMRPQGDGVEVEIRALVYDHAGAAARMREAGLPREYEQALRTGFWDNMDILPPEERARRGRPIAWERLSWMPDSHRFATSEL
ncbi:MAG: metallophosphoesterase family protein [Alphaproteobacteria bacterium]|nr:metallophosphoesterase family protein [Alphaproteobacteria bacterium]